MLRSIWQQSAIYYTNFIYNAIVPSSNNSIFPFRISLRGMFLYPCFTPYFAPSQSPTIRTRHLVTRVCKSSSILLYYVSHLSGGLLNIPFFTSSASTPKVEEDDYDFTRRLTDMFSLTKLRSLKKGHRLVISCSSERYFAK